MSHACSYLVLLGSGSSSESEMQMTASSGSSSIISTVWLGLPFDGPARPFMAGDTGGESSSVISEHFPVQIFKFKNRRKILDIFV